MAAIWLGIAFAISANFVFALSNVFFRKTEKDTSPTMINLFRTSIGVLSFFLIALFSGILPIVFTLPLDLVGLLMLSSIFGQVVGDSAYFYSQFYLGPTKALTISLTYPFFTILIDIFYLHVPFNPFILLSATIIGIGILLVSCSKRKSVEIITESYHQEKINRPKKGILLGILFAFIASLSWAIGITLTDISMTQINEIFSTERLTSIVGSLVRLPIAAFVLVIINYTLYGLLKKKNSNKLDMNDHLTYLIRGRSLTSWLWLFAGALIGTTLGLYLFTEAAYLAGAVPMAILITTGPIFTLVFDWIVNKEKISFLGLVGIVITLCGIIFITVL